MTPAFCLPGPAPLAFLFNTERLGLAGAGVVVAIVVASLGIHEAAHAWMAWKRGDSTAKDLGRMTLNPIAHIDPVMTILLPAISILTMGFLFGGAKPVPVNPRRFRRPHFDNALVALAGPVSNMLLAIFFFALFHLLVERLQLYDMSQVLPNVLYSAALANVILAAFNLVPIPPLDGSRVVTWLLPSNLRGPYNFLEPFGLIILLLLFYQVPAFSHYLQKSMAELALFLNRIATLGGLW
jgi:Zn-dependent protease